MILMAIAIIFSIIPAPDPHEISRRRSRSLVSALSSFVPWVQDPEEPPAEDTSSGERQW